jgi:predicted SAM-dependent methyltransferase
MFGVLEHIPVDEQLPFLRGVNAALKAGGTVVGHVPNPNSLVSNRYRWGDWTHHSSFTKHSIDFVLNNAGFRRLRDARCSAAFSYQEHDQIPQHPQNTICCGIGAE